MSFVDLLVSDTSALIDLERGTLLEAAFGLPHRITIPDLLYERELEDHGGDHLLGLGLVVVELTPEQVESARTYRRERPALSWPDVFALALAAATNGTLLTGDRRLRALAAAKLVPCHGLLWLLDQMHMNAVPGDRLLAGLQSISAHPRSRLPRREVEEMLARFAQ